MCDLHCYFHKNLKLYFQTCYAMKLINMFIIIKNYLGQVKDKNCGIELSLISINEAVSDRINCCEVTLQSFLILNYLLYGHFYWQKWVSHFSKTQISDKDFGIFHVVETTYKGMQRRHLCCYKCCLNYNAANSSIIKSIFHSDVYVDNGLFITSTRTVSAVTLISLHGTQ